MNPSETLEIVDSISAKALSDGFDALTADEQVVWLVSWVDFEVNLGGATGYLYNSAGDHLPDLSRALERIGCSKLARLASELNESLGAHCSVRDRLDRWRAFHEPADSVRSAMCSFEEAIQNCDEDYGQKLERFIRQRFSLGGS